MMEIMATMAMMELMTMRHPSPTLNRIPPMKIRRGPTLPALIALLAMVALAWAAPLAAQQVHTPPRGSPERRLLMDALRVRMQRELRKPMIFEVEHLRVAGAWAFAEVIPQQPDGSAFSYRGTPLEQAWRDGVVDASSVALLHRVGGQWRVVRLAIGPTDVAWIPWQQETGAPRAVFPYP